jgi:hypothetical protein
MAHDFTTGAPLPRLGAAVLLIAGLTAAPLVAHAQNLVQDPNFANGFNDYVDVCCDVTTMPGPNGNEAVLPGGSNLSQLIPTTPESLYLISFMASFTGPGTYTASFGDVTFTENPNQPGMFSFSATATQGSTLLNFATTTDSNTEFLSNLDVEAAPAPVPGDGALSVCVLLGVLAIRRLRGSLA